MRKLAVFNQVTLDGYFADANGDMGWAHKHDAEWNAFVAENATADDGPLLFGRITYEMMAAYWPTPLALRNDRVVAERMNDRPKVVFSRTLHAGAVEEYAAGDRRHRRRNPPDEGRAGRGHGHPRERQHRRPIGAARA